MTLTNTFDLAMTLIFDLWIWRVTNCLYVVDISAQLYWNSFIIKKVAGWTWIKFPKISLFLNTFDLAENLTFDLQTWVLHPTHRLYVVDICAHLYWNSFIVLKKSYRPDTNIAPHPPNFHFLYTFGHAVTLNIDLWTWLLHATHRLYVVDTSVQLYWNPFINKEVTGRTRT